MHTFGLAPSLASVKRLLGCLTLLRISAILLALLMSHWLSHCHNQEGTLWIENDTHLTLNPEDYLQLVHFLSSWGGHTWLQSTEYYSLNSPQSKQFNVVAGYSHEILWWDGAWSNNSLNILNLFARHIMAKLCRMSAKICFSIKKYWVKNMLLKVNLQDSVLVWSIRTVWRWKKSQPECHLYHL